jgi:hypothetical protein
VKESRLISCEPCLTIPSSEKSAEDEKRSQMEDTILDSLGFPYMNDRYHESRMHTEKLLSGFTNPPIRVSNFGATFPIGLLMEKAFIGLMEKLARESLH